MSQFASQKYLSYQTEPVDVIQTNMEDLGKKMTSSENPIAKSVVRSRLWFTQSNGLER